MKKKVAIVACALGLPGEKGYSRFPFLANLLSEKGYKVDLYTSTFNHWEKAQRKKRDIDNIRKGLNYNVILGYERGYKKNLDIRRVFSHIQLSNSILKAISEENKKEKYDLLYVIIPDNVLSAKICKFGKDNNIPVIVDVEDLWPEGMIQEFDVPVLSDIVFSPFSYYANKTYKNADAFVGTSDEYRDEPLKYHVNPDLQRITVYVGCELEVFDKGVKEYFSTINKPEDEFWVIYTGTLGSSYDIDTLVKAAQNIKTNGIENIKFKILGGGSLEEHFRNTAAEKPCNVEFLGYQPYEKMAAYIAKSDVTINSFVKKASQSIVNKIGDYLAGGKPMINTCSSPEFRKKVEKDGFGVNIEAENIDALVDAIMHYFKNHDECIRVGEVARITAERDFDRRNSYIRIVDLIEKLIEKRDTIHETV